MRTRPAVVLLAASLAVTVGLVGSLLAPPQAEERTEAMEPSAVCNGAPLPGGFAMTPDGMPHAIKPPYEPVDQYNPTSIGGFIRTVTLKVRQMNGEVEPRIEATPQELADQVCLLTTAGEQLIAGSVLEEYDGAPVRWYPYLFEFDANPSEEFDALPSSGWYSGLAQGFVLGALSELHHVTGEQRWLDHGHETFRSFLVPLAEGGFTNRENGFLWFEEYPTTPEPTTVLNGHMEALIGLDIWHRTTGEPGARALFDEAVADLQPYLDMSEVEVDGGLATSYDLVRGYPATPVRFRPDGAAEITAATFNGDPVQVPVTGEGSEGPTEITNGDMSRSTDGLGPDGWDVINADSGGLDDVRVLPGSTTEGGQAVRVRTSAQGWRGVQQVVGMVDDDGTRNFAPGEWLALSFDARLEIEAGRPGIAGKVAVYSTCIIDGATEITLLYESQRHRSQLWASYHHTFRAPADDACGIQVQLLSSTWGNDSTAIWYDDVSLRRAAPRGDAFQPEFRRPDNLMVFRRPVTELQLAGSGTGRVQVYDGGLWQDMGPSLSLTSTPQTVVIPERYTGRNIHLAYHENHIDELVSLCLRSGEEFFADHARAWQPMAPAHNGTTVPECSPPTDPQLAEKRAEELRHFDVSLRRRG